MAIPSDGSYGVPKGLVFSFPVHVKNGEYSIVQGLSLDAFAKEKIAITQKVSIVCDDDISFKLSAEVNSKVKALQNFTGARVRPVVFLQSPLQFVLFFCNFRSHTMT